MKILLEGSEVISEDSIEGPDENWPKARICTGYGNNNNGCGAALLLDKSDLYQTRSSYYGHAVDGVQPLLKSYYLTFRCPCCKAETDMYDASNSPHLSISDDHELAVNLRG